jgi:hypothetical protein
LLLIACCALNGCATTPGRPPDALLPSELNLQAGQLDGKPVIAFGWLEYGFEKRFLFDNDKARTAAVYEPKCVSIEVPQSMRSEFEALNHRYVIIRGQFLADLAQDRVFLGLCNRTGIRVESISSPGAT